MSNIQTGAERMPHDLSHLGFLAGQIGRLITISTTPVIAGDSFEMDAVGALRLSPKFMRASIKMIGVSNLQSFIASMTQKLTLSDISDESKNYLDKAGITTACLRIKSKWTA